MQTPSGTRLAAQMSSASFYKDNLSVKPPGQGSSCKTRTFTNTSEVWKLQRNQVPLNTHPRTPVLLGIHNWQQLTRQHGASQRGPPVRPRRTLGAARPGRAPQRPLPGTLRGERLEQKGRASPPLPFSAGAVPERGAERSCPGLYQLGHCWSSERSGQSSAGECSRCGCCKLLENYACLVEYLQQLWSKLNSGEAFEAPCSFFLSHKHFWIATENTLNHACLIK